MSVKEGMHGEREGEREREEECEHVTEWKSNQKGAKEGVQSRWSASNVSGIAIFPLLCVKKITSLSYHKAKWNGPDGENKNKIT